MDSLRGSSGLFVPESLHGKNQKPIGGLLVNHIIAIDIAKTVFEIAVSRRPGRAAGQSGVSMKEKSELPEIFDKIRLPEGITELFGDLAEFEPWLKRIFGAANLVRLLRASYAFDCKACRTRTGKRKEVNRIGCQELLTGVGFSPKY